MPGRPSSTARLVAGYRARATRRVPEICADPWAEGLAGAEGLELSRAHDRLVPEGVMWMAVRTGWLDERVRRFITDPANTQVVVLGAGLDTRAARLARPGVRFFEVDLPASQEQKLARLAALGDYPREAATYVRCDFERDDFLEALLAAGLRAEAPVLFVLEGVTPYLGDGSIRETFSRIASGSAPQSVLVFDHMNRALAEGRSSDPSDRGVRRLVSDLGEPFRWGTDDPRPLLIDCGFHTVRVLSFTAAGQRLTGRVLTGGHFRNHAFAMASPGHGVDLGA